MALPDRRLDSCHVILKTALQEAPPESWPPGPFALGGPVPVCPATGLVELSVWFASLAVPLLRDEVEQAEARQVLKEVRGFLAKRRQAPAGQAHGGVIRSDTELGLAVTRLRVCGGPHRGDSRALVAVRRAARVAAESTRGLDEVFFLYLRTLAAQLVQLLVLDAGAATMPVRDFFVELDARLVRLECVATLSTLLAPGAVPDVAEVLWRSNGGKPRGLHFIVRLAEGDLGLVTELGGRRAWVRGGRDEVLASVPDALFPEAVRAVLRED